MLTGPCHPGQASAPGLPARSVPPRQPPAAPARDPAASQRSGTDHVAQLFAEDMRRRGYFAPVSPEATPAARSSGFRRLAGERRGDRVRLRSFATPAAAVRGWLASPPHRRVMLSYRYTVIGAGVANGSPILVCADRLNLGPARRPTPLTAAPQPVRDSAGATDSSVALRDRQQATEARLLRVTLTDTGGLHRSALRLPRRLDDVAVWVAALDADVV